MPQCQADHPERSPPQENRGIARTVFGHKDSETVLASHRGLLGQGSARLPAYFVGVAEDVTESHWPCRTRDAGLRRFLGSGQSDDSRGEAGRRSRQPGQERVPGEHEPRDSYPDDGNPGIYRYPSGRLGTEEAIESGRTIKRNGEHLLNVINDILDLSKIEAGKCTVDLQECSPSQIAAEVISLMKVRADAKGLPLTLEVGETFPRR